jgi:hypothetical protein
MIPGDQAPRRGWRKVAGLACALFGLQILAVWVVSGRATARMDTSLQPVAVSLTDMHSLSEAHQAMLSLQSPTLFALPHPESFSGDAWLVPRAPDYRVPAWTAEPRWLAPVVVEFGDDMTAYVRTQAPPAFSSIASVEPQFIGPSVNTAPLADRTLVTAGGALAGRRIVHTPSLPSVPVSGELADSVVEVLVGGDGVVFSVRLPAFAPSNQPAQRAADVEALRLARQVVFAPASGRAGSTTDNLTWGRLVFQWHGVTPAPAAPQ